MLYSCTAIARLKNNPFIHKEPLSFGVICEIIRWHCKSTFLPLMQLMGKLPVAFQQPVNLRLNLQSNNCRIKLNKNPFNTQS